MQGSDQSRERKERIRQAWFIGDFSFSSLHDTGFLFCFCARVEFFAFHTARCGINAVPGAAALPILDSAGPFGQLFIRNELHCDFLSTVYMVGFRRFLRVFSKKISFFGKRRFRRAGPEAPASPWLGNRACRCPPSGSRGRAAPGRFAAPASPCGASCSPACPSRCNSYRDLLFFLFASTLYMSEFRQFLQVFLVFFSLFEIIASGE